MMMPEVSDDHFLKALKDTILKNQAYIPAHHHQEALYVRPYMIGVGDNMGLKPSNEYIFGVAVTPVGTYFKGDEAGKYLIVDDDRVAPNGTGPYKVGGNYGAVLRTQFEAKQQGYMDALFLDPKTHTKIDEFGGANIFFIKHNTYITPKSQTILKSITNDSLMIFAASLGLQIETRDVLLEELDTFEEAAACGTAASVSPIGSITYRDKEYIFSHTIGHYTKQLRMMLLQTQYGDIDDTFNMTYIL
jgi:branched-chain amino acid aminotransferase